jgi:hypothetical protein
MTSQVIMKLVLFGGVALSAAVGFVELSHLDRHPPGPVEMADAGGTIYFRRWSTPDSPVWTMNADGSGKARLPDGVRGEPSWRLHAGHRWFLDVRELPGETYPDGQPRRELVAIRADGRFVQLTTQYDLEPSTATPRWLRHTDDRRISWIARRWSHGQPVEGGIYTAQIDFDHEGNVTGLVEQPLGPLVPLELVTVMSAEAWWSSPAPDVYSHDWSPGGSAIVYDSTRGGLFIANLETHERSVLIERFASDPVWSPDGSRIAFKCMDPVKPIGTIDVVRPDGTRCETVVGSRTMPYFAVSLPLWSPTGTHVCYQRVGGRIEPIGRPIDIDVFRVLADGSGQRNLTADTDISFSLIAWR